MEKNVIVVDEQGNQIGVTYPKRAKGLVKNGRARYVDNFTICLACPPNLYLEDKTMTEEIMNQNPQAKQIVQTAVAESYDIVYILHQLENIASDTAYLEDALHQLKHKEDGAFAIGIGNAVEAREQTNRKLIDFYLEIYRDMKRDQKKGASSTALEYADRLMDTIVQCGPGDESKMSYLQETLKFILNQQIKD